MAERVEKAVGDSGVSLIDLVDEDDDAAIGPAGRRGRRAGARERCLVPGGGPVESPPERSRLHKTCDVNSFADLVLLDSPLRAHDLRLSKSGDGIHGAEEVARLGAAID